MYFMSVGEKNYAYEKGFGDDDLVYLNIVPEIAVCIGFLCASSQYSVQLETGEFVDVDVWSGSLLTHGKVFPAGMYTDGTNTTATRTANIPLLHGL